MNDDDNVNDDAGDDAYDCDAALDANCNRIEGPVAVASGIAILLLTLVAAALHQIRKGHCAGRGSNAAAIQHTYSHEHAQEQDCMCCGQTLGKENAFDGLGRSPQAVPFLR